MADRSACFEARSSRHKIKVVRVLTACLTAASVCVKTQEEYRGLGAVKPNVCVCVAPEPFVSRNTVR